MNVQQLHKATIDNFIAVHNLDKKTDIPSDQLKRIVERSLLSNALAFIFADVANSFLLDCQHDLEKFKDGFSRETKQACNNLYKSVKAARYWSERLTTPMYHDKDVDALCIDSDWWMAFAKLVTDRIGIDGRKTQMLLEFLLNMPEGDSPFHVTMNDFIKK